MPVRSLNSSVMVWPNRNVIDTALQAWAGSEADHRPELVQVGYFGSYACGDWDVGSDLDMVIIVGKNTDSWERRPCN